MENRINTKRKININKPLDGSFANVCIEFKTPDLTKKVPLILRENVAIDSITVQFLSEFLFSNTNTVCINAVKQNQGINETFSTGSQHQNPPQPKS